MDVTTSIVILIFVFSIFSGVTGQKEKAAKQIYYPPGQIITAPSAKSIPSPNYQDGYSEDVNVRIVNFIKSYGKNVSLWEANLMAESISKYGSQFNVNPRLLTALIARESRFNRFAISSSGAQGLGQLMPSTARNVGVSDPFDIEQNIMGTSRYFKSCLDRFTSSSSQVGYAIAGYLEGPGNIERNKGYKSSSNQYVEDILALYQRI